MSDAPQTTKLPRQTRSNFNVDAVMAMLREGGEPEQGWPSLVEEACHRIYRYSIHVNELSDQVRSWAEQDV